MADVTTAIDRLNSRTKSDREGRLVRDFIRRRVPSVHQAQSGLTTGGLVSQVTNEIKAVRAYIKERIASLAGTDSNVDEPHLDLAVVANIFGGDPDDNYENRLGDYTKRRKLAIRQIVWRAVTLHDPYLWSTAETAVLRDEVVAELLDYRLRSIEQLITNVNSGADIKLMFTSNRDWTVVAGEGPWRDGLVTRCFEYPNLPRDPFSGILTLMAAEGWDTGEDGDPLINYNVGHGFRFATNFYSGWASWPEAGDYLQAYQTDVMRVPSDFLEAMFAIPRDNFLDRCWLFCDQVATLTNLDALRFSLLRRYHDNVLFNNLLNQQYYVVIGPTADDPYVEDGTLMQDVGDLYFENVKVGLDELQVGDHVCFWNSKLYDLLVGVGAWPNEWSRVIGVDLDADDGSALESGLELAGHGIRVGGYSDMGTDLVTHWSALLSAAQQVILATVSTTGTNLAASPHAPIFFKPRLLFNWSPYGDDFDNPGPWWLEIPHGDWSTIFQHEEDALAGIPGAVSHDFGTEAIVNGADRAIYFPLFEPPLKMNADEATGWAAYARQKSDPEHVDDPIPSKLAQVVFNSRFAPGLKLRDGTIPVVRPKVRIL